MKTGRNVTLNFGAIAFGKLSYTLQIFCSVPLFLSHWGQQRYGEWLVLSAIPTWMSMSDVGFGTVAANEMVLRCSRGDKRGARQCLHSAWAAMLCLMVLGALVLLPISFFVNWRALLRLNLSSAHEIAVTIALLGVTVLLAFPLEIGRGMLRSEGRAAEASFLYVFKPIADLCAIYIGLAIKSGITGVSFALLISQAAFVTAFIGIASLRSPELRLGVRECAKSEMRYLLTKGVAFCLFPLGNSLCIQGSLLAVNAALGPAQVVIFGTVRTLTRSGYQLMTVIYAAVLPEMGRLMGAKDWARARRLHRISVYTAMAFAIGMLVLLGVFGPRLYSLWTAKVLTIDRSLLLLFFVVLGEQLGVAHQLGGIDGDEHP